MRITRKLDIFWNKSDKFIGFVNDVTYSVLIGQRYYYLGPIIIAVAYRKVL